MSLTESYMLPLGTKAPDFKLLNPVGKKEQTLENLRGENGTLIVFMCNHCPYVIHLLDAIVEYSKEIKADGIATIGISSNDIKTYPQDSPKYMKELALEKEFNFPYLYDESQKTAHAYQAACTPDFYLFDKDLKLYYRGRFDKSRPKTDVEITGLDIREASTIMLEGRIFEKNQAPSMGCNIKWKAGNEPAVFTI